MHESLFPTVYGLKQISRFVFPRLSLQPGGLEMHFLLTKRNWKLKIKYDAHFVCKVHCEILYLTALCRSSYWRAEVYGACMSWPLYAHSSAVCCMTCFSVVLSSEEHTSGRSSNK